MMLGILAFFVPACSKGQTTNITNANGSSNKIVWLAANEDLLVREGESDTNGLDCGLRITNDRAGIGLRTPTFEVLANSKATNYVPAYWAHYPTNYLEIELLDSTGKPVKRTPAGELYKQFPSQEQVEEAFLKCYRYSHRRTVQGFTSIGCLFTRLSLPDLFELKQPGEYTLKVRMRLLERNLDKPLKSKFTITPLPEVTAKIQIRREDTPLVKLPPNAQTNLLNN